MRSAELDTLTGVVGTAQAAPRTRSRHLVFWVSVAWMVVLGAAAVTAPWLPFLEDPDQFGVGRVEEGPSWSHWFGTDELGRDMFSRSVWGSRTSLSLAFVAVGVGLVLGGFLGLVAGFYGRWADAVISSVVSISLALPALVLALFLVTVLGQSFWNVVIAVSTISVPSLARITRAQTLRFSSREFVLVSRLLGAHGRRALVREVLPNVVPAMTSIALLAIAIVLTAEGGLAFIGKSVQAPSITWGGILASGRGGLEDAPHVALTTGGVMFLTILALNFIGDELLKRFDVREARL